jgi:hypothetical protein
VDAGRFLCHYFYSETFDLRVFVLTRDVASGVSAWWPHFFRTLC